MNKALIKKEIKKELKPTLIWAFCMVVFSLLIILIFPLLKDSLEAMLDSFDQVPGMDVMFGIGALPITKLIGFYGMEIGVIISLGGSIFAGIIGGRILVKEEKDKTIEFLATNPIKRKSIFNVKLLVTIGYIFLFNLIIVIVSVPTLLMVDPSIDIGKILLFHLMQLVLHLQIGIMSFALSVFGKKTSTTKGAILPLIFYVFFTIFNILKNDFFKVLKWLTPFTYSDPVVLLQDTINFNYISLIIGLIFTITLIVIAHKKYKHKDLL